MIKVHGGKLILDNKEELAISNLWAETTAAKKDSRPYKYMLAMIQLSKTTLHVKDLLIQMQPGIMFMFHAIL